MPGTGYTSIADYLAANQGTVARERGDLASSVGSELASAQAGAVGGGSRPEALDHAEELGSVGGLADLLAQRYGGPGYSSDKAAFDASLLFGAPEFAPVQQQAKTLGDTLDKPPPKPAPPPPIEKEPPVVSEDPSDYEQQERADRLQKGGPPLRTPRGPRGPPAPREVP